MEPSWVNWLTSKRGGVLGHGTELELNLLGAIGAIGDNAGAAPKGSVLMTPRGSVLMTAGVVGVICRTIKILRDSVRFTKGVICNHRCRRHRRSLVNFVW